MISKFELPWPILKVVLEGTSILDVPKLELNSMEEATTFATAYGFDLSNSDDIERLWSFFNDAILFIEKTLADSDFPKVPDHLRDRQLIGDIRRLLLLASQKFGDPDQIWACAILRLMHVLIHWGHDPRLRIFQRAQNQILSRLDNFLYTDPKTGSTYLGRKEEGQGIKLMFFKKKDRKDRDREIIKLLHKAESLVEEIYDRVGFRVVTETKLDSLRTVVLLLKENIISLPNVRPGRSRNRLVDISRVQFEFDRIAVHLKKWNETPAYVEKMIKRLENRIGFKRKAISLLNPHTSEYYKAIQFTCRELVKVPNPNYTIMQRVKEQLQNLHGATQILKECFPVTPPQMEYYFFPYEIQIMDVKAYTDSIFGKSNHDEYRRKQLQSARARVFGKAFLAK